MLPVLVWIFVTTGATQAPAAAASLPSAEPIQFVRYASMKAHATVAGDVVKVTGGAGDPLLSSIQVGDFELSGDVRIASPRTDAAILVRALARGDRQDRRLYAILIGDATDPQHLAGTVIGQDAGVRFTIEPDASGAHRAGLTTWQHFDIRCAGRHLRVFEDGRLLTDADVPDESYGRVGVEVSKGAIELRDWRVTSLDRFRDTRPLLESLANPDAVDGEKKIPGLVVPRLLRVQADLHRGGDASESHRNTRARGHRREGRHRRSSADRTSVERRTRPPGRAGGQEMAVLSGFGRSEACQMPRLHRVDVHPQIAAA
jgi:hypothetical protein